MMDREARKVVAAMKTQKDAMTKIRSETEQVNALNNGVLTGIVGNYSKIIDLIQENIDEFTRIAES